MSVYLNNSNAKYGPVPELKVRKPLTNVAQIIDSNSLPCDKFCVPVPFKRPVFEIHEDEECDKENTLHFKLQGSSVSSKVQPPKRALTPWKAQPPKRALTPWTGTSEVGNSDEDSAEVLSSEEECDISCASLPDHVVGLFKYEDEGNYGFPMIWYDSLNESQDSFRQAWLATKQLYDYTEYSKDVYKYLREAEIRHQPQLKNMLKQPEINLDMRSILIDWLVEVAGEYELQNETLYLSVSLIDRFLSLRAVSRETLQLLGTASMFIAAKYEETSPPKLKEFVYITAETYVKNQFLVMESYILTALDFNINVPTVYCFLKYISCATNIPKNVLFLAQYLCELTLLKCEPFLQFLPSQIASAAISLSNYTLGYISWDAELEQTTGYKFKDLTNAMECLHAAYRNDLLNEHQAIRKKYNSTAYNGVSSIPAPEELLCL